MTRTLSVVIVARDEADRVGDCIESVLALDDPAPDEVLLVDSNSSDGTVDVALDYPLTILRIPSDELSSPSAGRQVGFRHADGDRVLFVDGDMRLRRGWLGNAVDALESGDDVAGVDGLLLGEDADRRREVEYLRGVALYETAALRAVGGFDPWLRALEDVDLGYRLRRAGYRLLRLPTVVASHPTDSDAAERLRRWRRGYYLSNGQVLRKSIGDPTLLARWLYRFRLSLFVAGWLALGLALAATRRSAAVRGWAGASALGFAAGTAVNGARWTLSKISVRLGFFLLGLGIGFVRGSTDAEYPFEQIEVVRRPRMDDV